MTKWGNMAPVGIQSYKRSRTGMSVYAMRVVDESSLTVEMTKTCVSKKKAVKC